jgi:hypothetical protein
VRPRIIDTFPFHDELDILEMRLTTLYDVVDWFVIVEADVTHQDRPKPAYFRDNKERFEPFRDKIISVWATGLPTMEQDPDSWAREIAQRAYAWDGLEIVDARPDDIVFHGDVDEIPNPLHARNVRPRRRLEPFGMRGHYWAIDWLHPEVWGGTVAATVRQMAPEGRHAFQWLRVNRNQSRQEHMHDAGWHFSWLGGPARATAKVNSFCHPEVEGHIRGAIANDNFYWREGFHVDGQQMTPVEVDDTFPKWIRDGHAPRSWYRPRIGAPA